MSGTLPVGFVVELDPGVRRLDGGTVLFGGDPPRLLRLAPAAARLLFSDRLTVRDRRSATLARTLLNAGAAHPRPVGGPSADEVTVVIPVRDNATGLARLLGAVDGPAVVVDDGSAVPVTVPGGVTLLRHNDSRGPAAARNTGLAAASTPFVAFLDSDVVPADGWLSPLLAHFADPACALVAPRIVGTDRGRSWLARYESIRSSLDLGTTEAPVVPRSRVAYVPSAAIVVRRDAVHGLGGFDETMTVAEDVDLCWRLHERGWVLRYEPRSHVAHEHRTAAGSWSRRKAFYGTGAAALARRHPGQVPPVALSRWAAVTCVLAATGTPTGAVAAVLVTASAAVRLVRRLPVARPVRLSAELIPHGLVGAAWQLASAAWRHWWPAALALAVASRRARRVIVAAGVVEGISDWYQHRDSAGGRPLDPVRYVGAKRLDDLAYGTGLWVGAWRHRSTAALRPHLQKW